MLRPATATSSLLALLCLATLAAAHADEDRGSVAPAAASSSVSRGWDKQRTPAPGEPNAIGEYSAGCIRGAQPLALDGPGYQVMHPSRLRYFGHPDLVGFLQHLGEAVQQAKLTPVLVGDMSQPRGGRAPGGHASHQTGLDVDLWYWAPKQADKRVLTAGERETFKARSILNGKTQAIAPAERERVEKLLRLTAADARVVRIFVHPWIKRELCTSLGPTEAERAWLGKVRPWYGHDDHFHVRLACPDGSTGCVPQAAPAPGDGCDELDYWLGADKRAARDEGQKQYQGKVARTPELPAACAALLQSP